MSDVNDSVLRLEIRGVVQGVGYRWFMVQAARRLGIGGWVRNRRDGSVEAVVAGPPAALEQIVGWARR
ncbi:MAG TPA: acylphosphatase, partial [Rhizobacter sp.]|nr:acylphosphatase [Rhizobacter sp.]